MQSSEEFDSHEAHIIVPRSRKIAFGMGGFAESSITDCMLFSLLPFYNIVLKLNAMKVGAALIIPRLWDAFTDPLMGQISDNTRSRWGRRRPYILIGGILVALAVCFLWNPPRSWTPDATWVYLVVTGVLFYSAWTIMFVPYYSLGAEVAIDYNERSHVQVYRGMFSRIGAMLGCGAFWFAFRFKDPADGFGAVGFICAAIALIVSFVVARFVHEEAEIQNQGRMGMLAGFAVVARNRALLIVAAMAICFLIGVLGAFPLGTYINVCYVFGGDAKAASHIVSLSPVCTHVVSFICMPLVAWVSTRIGKKRALTFGLVMYAIVPIFSWFAYIPGQPYWQLVYAACLGPGMALWMTIPFAMMADVCDVDELKTGLRREGVYLGLFTFLVKAGMSLTSFFNGICLNLAGYDPEVTVQSPGTILKLRLILMWFPFAFCMLSVLILLWYPLSEKRVREIRATLEQRRSERLATQAYPGKAGA